MSDDKIIGWLIGGAVIVFVLSTISLFIYGFGFFPNGNAFVITRILWGIGWGLIPAAIAGLIALLLYGAVIALGIAGFIAFIYLLFSETFW